MPPLPFVTHAMRITLKATSNAKDWTTSWAVEYSGTWDDSDVAGLLTAMKTPLTTTGFKGLFSEDTTMHHLEAMNLANNSDPITIGDDLFTGTVAGGAVPNNCVASCYYPSATRYRGGHFHQYWTGFTNGDTVGDQLQWTSGLVNQLTTTLDNVQAAINDYAAAGSLGALEMIGIHYRHAGSILVTPTHEPLDTVIVHQAIRPRSRRLGRA